MAWFDATPTGRIINRFSNDINEIDTGIGVGIQNALEQYTSGRLVHSQQCSFVPGSSSVIIAQSLVISLRSQ
jgi:hypothetical protein